MRLNAPTPPIFPAPDTVPVRGVDGSRIVQPVNNEETGNREPPAPPRTPTPYRPLPGQTGFLEQRDLARRTVERRQEQRAVMLDTRSGQDRRKQSRRQADDTPLSVSIKA
jgi:hypothetical protein